MSHHDSLHKPVSADLIAKAIERDEESCTEIVECLYPMVLGIVRRNLPRHQAAEDLAQQVFIKVFTKLEKFRGDSPFENWVSRIATLRPRDELVVRLLHLEEKSVAEIALETGWSPSKIKVTAMRAREKLKKTLRRLESKSRQEKPHESSLIAIPRRGSNSGQVVGEGPVPL